ncbi:hypothetical protein LHA31_10215 [Carnobacterium viridans]|uniref:NUMOD1 domain-containing protein n=1 Tax=Carnobacterium viridans TaxID=174587 RepID=A0A1H0YVS4_9LACT|nr:NUMOD1 domain-containing DNA-binding protein [Carnobacterium viridans]UDE94919.1 hypothetical protein LHA31_10215 [Carnobacterium viridans]SDQ19289.1 NUMOD1 domain-containing protein [Carnobacterium viridans]
MTNTQTYSDRNIDVANVTVGDVVECQTQAKGIFKARIEIIYDHSAVVEISKRERTVVKFKDMVKDGHQVKVTKQVLKRYRNIPKKEVDPNAAPKKKRIRTPKRRIEQWTMDGVYINSFDSIAEANKHFNIAHSGIPHCLRKKTDSSLGYRWKYAGDEFPEIKNMKKINHHTSKSILQIKNGVVINEFASVKDAGKALGVHPSGIAAGARKKQKTSYGFEWEYKK